jgi:F0F1-type ATP synthase alpha subunit
MNSFRATDDAIITETYQDETGASATIKGNSRVPFEGSLQFILSQKGVILNTTEKRTPILLTGDDETVEITWNNTLEPGVYQLRTVLKGRLGAVKDMEENVIEAKPRVKSNTTDVAEKSDFPAGVAAIAMLVIVLLRRGR